jgi:hypothetical protein
MRFFVVVLALALTVGCFRPTYVPAVNGGAGNIALERAPSTAHCDREIQLLSSAPSGDYEEVRKVDAVCTAGYPFDCDALLRSRACALGADAVILTNEPEPPPAAAASPVSGYRMTRRGTAIRSASR